MRIFLTLFILSVIVSPTIAQPKPILVDEIVAVVGNNYILRSDVEISYLQLKRNFEGISPDSAKCIILDQLLVDKLMLYKAEIDSVVVSDERVEGEMERKLRTLSQEYGGMDKMESVLGKSVGELKSENRDKIKMQLRIQEIRQGILRDVKVGPSDVQNFFKQIPKDSLPYNSAEVEVSIFVRKPHVTPDEKAFAYQTLLEIREQIMNGKDFSLMASLYSQDPGSARNGGDLNYFGRNEMMPEFEATAFKLKPDEVSRIIETPFGYHIIKLVDRKGERVRARHILIKPQTVNEDVRTAKHFCDSVRQLVIDKTATFEELVKKYSDDEESRTNGGFITDPSTGQARISVEELDKELNFIIEKMKPGQISDVMDFVMPDYTKAYRLIYLKSYIPPHVTNPVTDYQKIQAATMERKRQTALDEWVKHYHKKAYVRINVEYANSPLLKRWAVK
ncbi:MAG: peptidylprolyl isomerase [Bacteroidota bacterium]|nr:peptidylprolyl isomerase [Bacteroidota bacterium]